MSRNNQVSLAGEFAVLSQLFYAGLDASLTLGNTKGVDIFISNPENGNQYKVEVKTKRGFKISTERCQWGPMYDWQMNEKHEALRDKKLYYCFVRMDNNDGDIQSKFFIVPSKVVADYVKAEHQWWIEGEGRNETPNRTFRLGTDDEFEYPVKTPLTEEFENRWDFLK